MHLEWMNLTGNKFITQHNNDLKHTANAVTESVMDRPPRAQHYLSSVGSFWQRTEQKAETSKEKLWISWRTIPEDYWNTRKLPEWVQAVLKNKGSHTKYTVSLLELYKLWFHLICCIYMCACFSISLHLLPLFIAKYKEIKIGLKCCTA